MAYEEVLNRLHRLEGILDSDKLSKVESDLAFYRKAFVTLFTAAAVAVAAGGFSIYQLFQSLETKVDDHLTAVLPAKTDIEISRAIRDDFVKILEANDGITSDLDDVLQDMLVIKAYRQRAEQESQELSDYVDQSKRLHGPLETLMAAVSVVEGRGDEPHTIVFKKPVYIEGGLESHGRIVAADGGFIVERLGDEVELRLRYRKGGALETSNIVLGVYEDGNAGLGLRHETVGHIEMVTNHDSPLIRLQDTRGNRVELPFRKLQELVK